MKKIILKNGWWLIAAAWVYTLTFIFNNYWSKFSSLPSITKSFEKRVHKKLSHFETFYKDTTNIKRLARFDVGELENDPAKEDDAFYYLYADVADGLQLKYWSNSSIIPKPNEIAYKDTTRLVNYASGSFIQSVHILNYNHLIAVQLIPVRWQYFIANEYLSERYSGFAGLEKHIGITQTPTGFPVQLKTGNPLFYLEKKDNYPIDIFNWPSFIIGIIATFFLVVFVQRVANALVVAKNTLGGLICIVMGGCSIRLMLFYLNFPVNVAQLALFKPAAGSSSFLLFSLGDFLLNLLVLWWISYFLRRHEFTWVFGLRQYSRRIKHCIGAATGILSVVGTFLAVEATRQMILHPSVSFNVSNFFSLGWNTLFAIVCLYFLATMHYNFLHISNKIFLTLWPTRRFYKFVVIAISGLLILSGIFYWTDSRLFLFSIVWILVSFVLEDWIPQKFLKKIAPSTNFLFWIIWYAAILTTLVLNQNETKELQQRMRVAEKLGIQSDPTAEQLLNIALNSSGVRRMADNFNAFYDSSYNQYYLSTLQKEYFSDYLNRYETSFFLFDADKQGLFNKDSTSFETLNTVTEEAASTTRYPGIYYYESTFEKFSYIIRHPLLDTANELEGYLFITTTPSRFKKDAMVPELLKQLQEDNRENTLNYSYAVYDKGKLISSNRDFPFVTEITKEEMPKSAFEIRKISNINQLWFNAGNGRTIVIVKPGSRFTDGITLFAYLFGAFLIFVLIENILKQLVIKKRKLKLNPASIANFSIKAQIQGTVLLVSIISFVIIGFVTIVFFIYRFRQNNTNRLTKLITQVYSDLQKNTPLVHYLDPADTKPATDTKEEVEPFINRVAELQNVDVNLFNTNGDLITTSQPIVFERGIVSKKMNADAFYNLAIKKKVQFLQYETIGTLEYSSIYLPVRNTVGKTVGFLNIPYFSSQNELNQEISNFLVVLINFNAFIFLLAAIIAFFITNSITSSFSLIGEKMKIVGFEKNNEPIVWNRNDEIGTLVLQYNKMIAQLDESAKKLAKSERESAWREMAKQVAHEIKNPLTPMKLSLQYLQRSIDQDAPNVKEMAAKMAQNLVDQIDHLSKIASDFSQFGQIGLTRVETFDVHELLRQVVSLYEKNKASDIHLQIAETPAFIAADKTQINRLFTNLFQNAFEASSDLSAIYLHITENIHNGYITFSMEDRAGGIKPELTDHIFTPNFTTKNSGTGLGLAICREIAEKANGIIWFVTDYGVGTTFFIKLPLKIEE